MNHKTIRPIDSAALDTVAGAGPGAARSGPASFTNNTSSPAFVSWLHEGFQPASGSTYHPPTPLLPGESISVPAGDALRAKAYGLGGQPDREFKLDHTLPGRAYKFRH
jgi:hypothetical protein